MGECCDTACQRLEAAWGSSWKPKEEGGGGGRDETSVCVVRQPSVYEATLHVCFSLEWKGGPVG